MFIQHALHSLNHDSVWRDREKIMSPFKKLKNFDATANVLSYAYFQVKTRAKLILINK